MNRQAESMAFSLPRPTLSRLQVVFRMMWKESRQLWRLFATLLILAVVSHLIIDIASRAADIESRMLPHFLLPILFAIGAGSILVSMERDQRTLDWYDSLPISRRQIFVIKLIVGLMGLVLFWLLSYGIHVWSIRKVVLDFSSEGLSSRLATYSFAFQAVVLFVLSFSTAWIFRTTLIALLALIPINLAVLQVAPLLGNGARNQMNDFMEPSSLLCYSVSALAFLVMAWLRARHVWVTSSAAWLTWPSIRGAWIPKKVARTPPAPTSPYFALIWQVWRQNEAVISCVATGFGLLLILDLLLMPQSQLSQNTRVLVSNFGSTLFGLSLLGVMVLGTSAFASDSSKLRSRFLADRGVSIGLIWLTRWILPFLIVLLGLAICWAIGKYRNASSPDVSYFLNQSNTKFHSLALASLWFLFAMWWGQVCRSPSIAYIGVPAIGIIVTVYFGSSAQSSLLTSWWQYLLVGLMPLLATRIMARTWMEGRQGFRYYLGHLVMLLVALVIPWIPMLVAAWSLPRLMEQERSQLVEARRALTMPPASWQFSLSRKPYRVSEAVFSEGVRKEYENLPPLSEIMKQFMRELDQSFDVEAGPLHSRECIEAVLQEALLKSMHLEFHPDDQEALQRFRQAVGLLVKIIQRSRIGASLQMQVVIDKLEAELVDAAARPETRGLLGESLYRDLVTQLADMNARREARRRAVLIAWRPHRADENGDAEGGGYLDRNAFGGFVIFQNLDQRRTFDYFLHRFREVLTFRLLKLADCQNASEADVVFQDVAAMFEMKLGGLGEQRYQRDIPGSTWHTAWEQQAVELAKQLEFDRS